jgi:molybdopterin-guanine dinucleotide biosynthesis protein A
MRSGIAPEPDPRGADVGVAILAGGGATRLPGKLMLDADGIPLLVRVYRNVGRERETVIACAGSLPAAVDVLLPVPMVVDRRPGRGPLGGLVTTFARMRATWIFVVAGDAPFVDDALLARLCAARRPGDEAVVPAWRRGAETQREPLAALYERSAFLREGVPRLRAGSGSVRGVVERLSARALEIRDPRIFANINTAADYAAFRAEIARPPHGAATSEREGEQL